jgi:hypothetical protein
MFSKCIMMLGKRDKTTPANWFEYKRSSCEEFINTGLQSQLEQVHFILPFNGNQGIFVKRVCSHNPIKTEVKIFFN